MGVARCGGFWGIVLFWLCYRMVNICRIKKSLIGGMRCWKRLESRKCLPFFTERDIWVVAWGVCSGSELDGKGLEFGRPVLIYKKLNARKFFAIPLSGIKKDLPGWCPYVLWLFGY